MSLGFGAGAGFRACEGNAASGAAFACLNRSDGRRAGESGTRRSHDGGDGLSWSCRHCHRDWDS